MIKSGADPKVKKTLVRNVNQKVKPTALKRVVHDVGNGSSTSVGDTAQIQAPNELSQPTLCSSELLANYLSGVKNSLPPPLSEKDLIASKTELCSKVKRNFCLSVLPSQK